MYIVIKKKLFWSVKIVGSNNEIVFSSETYYNKSNALRAALRASELLGIQMEGVK